jgi:hypothetical protein
VYNGPINGPTLNASNNAPSVNAATVNDSSIIGPSVDTDFNVASTGDDEEHGEEQDALGSKFFVLL